MIEARFEDRLMTAGSTETFKRLDPRNLTSILDDFDTQVELDMQNLFDMSDEPEQNEVSEDAVAPTIGGPMPVRFVDDPRDNAPLPESMVEDPEKQAEIAESEDITAVGGEASDEPIADEALTEEESPVSEEKPEPEPVKDPIPDTESKNWLFEENIRLQEVERRLEEEKERLKAYEEELNTKAKDIEARNEKFIKDRAQFRDEMNLLTGQVTRERQRLKQDQQFFDKKMEILKAGFADLDKAKRELEAERMRKEAQTAYYGDDDIPGYGAPVARTLFVGISNPLMLKKRYKDLVKIYHPDNMAGDQGLFKAITIEYERLQGKIGNEGIG